VQAAYCVCKQFFGYVCGRVGKPNPLPTKNPGRCLPGVPRDVRQILAAACLYSVMSDFLVSETHCLNYSGYRSQRTGRVPDCGRWRCPVHGAAARGWCAQHWGDQIPPDRFFWTTVIHPNAYLTPTNVRKVKERIALCIRKLTWNTEVFFVVHWKCGLPHLHMGISCDSLLSTDDVVYSLKSDPILQRLVPDLNVKEVRMESEPCKWVRYCCRFKQVLNVDELPPKGGKYHWHYGFRVPKRVIRVKKTVEKGSGDEECYIYLHAPADGSPTPSPYTPTYRPRTRSACGAAPLRGANAPPNRQRAFNRPSCVKDGRLALPAPGGRGRGPPNETTPGDSRGRANSILV